MHRPIQFLVFLVLCYLTEDRTVCEEYNATTTAELSDEEEEDVGRRKIKKKRFDDFYVSGKK